MRQAYSRERGLKQPKKQLKSLNANGWGELDEPGELSRANFSTPYPQRSHFPSLTGGFGVLRVSNRREICVPAWGAENFPQGLKPRQILL